MIRERRGERVGNGNEDQLFKERSGKVKRTGGSSQPKTSRHSPSPRTELENGNVFPKRTQVQAFFQREKNCGGKRKKGKPKKGKMVGVEKSKVTLRKP